MNDDELDLLASAYLDGEATPDEVAMVERDPELLARVEAFRAIQVDGSITPPAGLVDQHVAEAMEEWFEAISSTGATSAQATVGAVPETGSEAGTEIEDTAGETAPVVDLAAASARRSERRARPAARRGMPSWLPAAAGLFIIGGGAIWAVGLSGGGDDTEAASVAADDTATEESSAESAELVESDEGDAEAMTAMADEAMEEESDDAMEDDAMADDGDDSAARTDADAAAPADGGADEAADDEESAEDAEEAFVDLEPQLVFDEVPDVDDLTDLPEPEADLERSLCGPEIVTPALGEPLGFIPVEIAGEPAEIYLFMDADGTEIRRLIDGDCQPLTP